MRRWSIILTCNLIRCVANVISLNEAENWKKKRNKIKFRVEKYKKKNKTEILLKFDAISSELCFSIFHDSPLCDVLRSGNKMAIGNKYRAKWICWAAPVIILNSCLPATMPKSDARVFYTNNAWWFLSSTSRQHRQATSNKNNQNNNNNNNNKIGLSRSIDERNVPSLVVLLFFCFIPLFFLSFAFIYVWASL